MIESSNKKYYLKSDSSSNGSNHQEENKDFIYSEYTSKNSKISMDENKNFIIENEQKTYEIRTYKKVGKVGVMLIGMNGNNGSTFIAGILANKHNICWNTKKGIQKPNYLGSLTQSSTTKIGTFKNEEIFVTLKDLIPMLNPNDIVISGWDINSTNIYEAMKRAAVLDYDLQEKLMPYTENIHPLPAISEKGYIEENQIKERGDNIHQGKTRREHLDQIRKDIQDFKSANQLDKILLLWTANTERLCEIRQGTNTTAEELLSAIDRNDNEISSSTIYATASILENCSFINGSPQNTFVPGLIELAEQKNVFLSGKDFKTGQTKFKTLMAEYLVQSGMKPISIVSYNHLGNNDGKNLNSEGQLKAKEKSKTSCVDDIINSNKSLYEKDEKIDHTVVIKYVPSAGDTKKAIDEYTSKIFMNGNHVLQVYNICEDSLLAVPLMIDLIILTELFERIEFRTKSDEPAKFKRIGHILDVLGYMFKAPDTLPDLPVVNSLTRQRNCIENFLKICVGLPVEDNLLLDYRIKN